MHPLYASWKTRRGFFSHYSVPQISDITKVAIVGDIDITSDTKKVINKMTQDAQLIFLNGDFSYSEDEKDTRKWFSKLFANYGGKIFGSLGNHDLGLSDVYKRAV